MNCPQCSHPTGVTDSRPAVDGAAIKRRRKCSACGLRFKSIEVFLEEGDVEYTTHRLVRLSGLIGSMSKQDRDILMEVARRFAATGVAS